MAGQFSFGRDGGSAVHSPMPAMLASMPEENRTVILTLFTQGHAPDIVLCSACHCSLLCFLLFFSLPHLAIHALTLVPVSYLYIYAANSRGEIWRRNLDMLGMCYTIGTTPGKLLSSFSAGCLACGPSMNNRISSKEKRKHDWAVCLFCVRVAAGHSHGSSLVCRHEISISPCCEIVQCRLAKGG